MSPVHVNKIAKTECMQSMPQAAGTMRGHGPHEFGNMQKYEELMWTACSAQRKLLAGVIMVSVFVAVFLQSKKNTRYQKETRKKNCTTFSV